MASGRTRDTSIDARLLAATIDTLAEVGFDSMTISAVIARAGVGKAAVYRRWDSKTQLVREALSWMSRSHLELDSLPDTGSLRGDLLAVLKPQSIEESERKLRVLSRLGSFVADNQEFLASRSPHPFDAWMKVNRAILERAVEWGELPVSADIDTASQALVSMAAYRGLIEHKSFDPQFFQQLIDRVLLPILQAGGQPEILGDPHHG